MSAALCWRCVVTDFFLSTTLKGIPSDPQSHQSRPPGSETLIASEARRQRLPAVNNEPSRPTSLGLAPRDLMLRGNMQARVRQPGNTQPHATQLSFPWPAIRPQDVTRPYVTPCRSAPRGPAPDNLRAWGRHRLETAPRTGYWLFAA